MPTPAEPGRPTRRLLGRGPGVAAAPAPQEALPDPAPSRNRGETPGSPPTPVAPPAERPVPDGAAPVAAEGTAGPAEDSETTAPGTRHPADAAVPADTARAAEAAAPAPESASEPATATASAIAPAPAPAFEPGLASGSASAPATAREPGAVSATAPASVAGPAAAAGSGGGPAAGPGGEGRFVLRLDNFEGPFDLLLQLISRHKLDVTEVALSKVTDEFMAHIRAMGPDWDLDQTTEFLVVAATLLDLKAARLLPVAEVEDEADLALLEARDLLFARLLQYKAYKQVAEIFRRRAEDEGRRYPRTVGLEPHLAGLLPDVVISIGARGFARLAVQAMQPKAKPQVYVDHIHAPLVSVREQAGLVVAMLRARGEATFQELTEDAPDTLTVVARFLALLELYREKAVVLEQEEALRTLTVRWSGADGAGGDGDGLSGVSDEFDRIVEVKE
ncbi:MULTISPECIES: segregation/condensation protein A [unclassified Streptomyces]|uniref:segregation/condensation protein A n=1 Tax=unclassified Streptomyces TaxID=2593676 RepID=UPI00225BB93D|nr:MULTISPECIES: segregation/condensation protein A [unclassified Streptomyces]MCX4525097.1 segregation/condensation protein A [Streptomyces sp. NBC_01551]MCX4544392.1 segregation/condensation protein A [Streptomyces sp. NBC_01565]